MGSRVAAIVAAPLLLAVAIALTAVIGLGMLAAAVIDRD